MDKKIRTRNLIFAIIGIISLLSKYYSGPLKTFIVKYGGSIVLPFGLYYLLQFLRLPKITNKLVNAGYAFGLVCIIEILQAIGLFGVFDWADFFFYVIGVVVAVAVDVLTSKNKRQQRLK